MYHCRGFVYENFQDTLSKTTDSKFEIDGIFFMHEAWVGIGVSSCCCSKIKWDIACPISVVHSASFSALSLSLHVQSCLVAWKVRSHQLISQ